MADEQTHAYLQLVLDHTHLVGHYLQRAVSELVGRAIVHDASKFGPIELEPYAAMRERFETAEYGSPEYLACCEAIKPAMEHHIHTNRHHPEYFPNGINDMNLLDVTEMVCDWIAASQRAGGRTLRLDMQRTRFGIGDQLYGIICRTAHALVSHDGYHLEIVE